VLTHSSAAIHPHGLPRKRPIRPLRKKARFHSGHPAGQRDRQTTMSFDVRRETERLIPGARRSFQANKIRAHRATPQKSYESEFDYRHPYACLMAANHGSPPRPGPLARLFLAREGIASVDKAHLLMRRVRTRRRLWFPTPSETKPPHAECWAPFDATLFWIATHGRPMTLAGPAGEKTVHVFLLG